MSGLGSSGIKLRAFWSPEVKYLWLDFAAALNLGLLPQINSTWGDISTLRATLRIWVTPGQDKHESDVPRWSGAAHREGWSAVLCGAPLLLCALRGPSWDPGEWAQAWWGGRGQCVYFVGLL